MTKFITNQNIEINLELAGVGDRILAFLIDVLIIGIYAVTATIFVASVFPNSSFLAFVFYIPVFFYSLFFEIYTNGQTPGKKARDIKVVKLNGGSPGILNYLLRWILRPIDFLLYGSFALVSIISTKNGQRLGDLAAGTTVIKIRSTFKLNDVGSYQRDKNYTVVFPQVKRLNDKQIEIIRRSLKMRKDGFEGHGMEELATRTQEFLKIETEMYPITFLYTIMKDYEHIHDSSSV